MSFDRSVRYPTKWLPPTGSFPFGVPKNSTTETSKDGVPFEKDFISDTEGFFQGLLSRRNISLSGNPDTALISDYLDALGFMVGITHKTINEAIADTTLKPGMLITTQDNNSSIRGGGANYIFKTDAQAISDGDFAATPDNRVHHTSVVPGFALILQYVGFISADTAGGLGDDSTDNLAVFDAIAAAGASLFLPDKIYRTSGTTDFELSGQDVFGVGQGKSRVRGTHLAGAIFRFKHQYHKCRSFSLLGTAARSAEPFTANGFGLHFESDDVADDANVTRMRNINVADVEVDGQTGAAIYIVGPVSDGSSLDRCRLTNNEGHGVAIDRGFLGGRTNKAAFPTGVLNINNCLGFGNTGHPVAVGHKDDTTTTQAVRVVIDNFDANVSDMVQAQLYESSAKHGFWLAGSNNELNSSVVSGSGSEIGAFVKGTNIHLRNFRQVETAATLEVGDNVAGLPTNGVFLDGVNVINTVAQVNAVILSNATDIKNIHINIPILSDIDALVDTTSVPGLVINSKSQTLVKLSDQAVNNSTSMVDVADLEYYLGVNDKVEFKATIFYSGDATADLRLSVGGPAGAVDIKFSPPGSVKVGSTNTLEVVEISTSFGTLIILGTNASERCFVLEGYIENGATAGLFTLRFAQLAAVVGDTIIHKGSNLSVTKLN